MALLVTKDQKKQKNLMPSHSMKLLWAHQMVQALMFLSFSYLHGVLPYCPNAHSNPGILRALLW